MGKNNQTGKIKKVPFNLPWALRCLYILGSLGTSLGNWEGEAGNSLADFGRSRAASSQLVWLRDHQVRPPASLTLTSPSLWVCNSFCFLPRTWSYQVLSYPWEAQTTIWPRICPEELTISNLLFFLCEMKHWRKWFLKSLLTLKWYDFSEPEANSRSKPWEERLCLEIKIRMVDDWNVMDFCKCFKVLPRQEPSIFLSMDLKGLWCNWEPAMWISYVHGWDSGCLGQTSRVTSALTLVLKMWICSNTVDMSENHLSIMQSFISSTRNIRWKQKTAVFWPNFVVRSEKQISTETRRDFTWMIYCKEGKGARYSCSMEEHPPWGPRFGQEVFFYEY